MICIKQLTTQPVPVGQFLLGEGMDLYSARMLQILANRKILNPKEIEQIIGFEVELIDWRGDIYEEE